MSTAMQSAPRGRSPFIGAHRVLFPVAVAFALVSVPLWLGRYFLGNGPAPAGGIPWHGHEMVFGYALAVVGGYLMTRISRPALAAVCACWLAGRLAVLVPDVPAVLDVALALAYPVSLFVVAGLPFLRAAKTGRNAVFAPLLASFAVAAFIAHSGLGHEAGRRGVLFGLDLLTMLLFVMGGRIMAAATSGAWRRQGQRARNVAQGALERLGLAAIAVLAVTEAAGGGGFLATVAAATAGAAAGIRLVRWRAYGLLDEPELAVLYVGYGWVCLGLVARAAAFAGAPIPEIDALHGITIGAIGTLTMAVMGRATQQRALRAPHLSGGALIAVALVSAAAILRLLAAVPSLREPMLIAAGLSWVAAFALFAVFLAGQLRDAGARLAGDAGEAAGGGTDGGADVTPES